LRIIIICETEKLIFDIFNIATGKGKVGKETFMDGFVTSIPNLGDKHSAFSIHFEWDPHHMGIPGAFYVKNFTQDEIFLVSLTLEDVASQETTNFICNSWIYNAEKYQTERIFFANKVMISILSNII
jgi:linoleate 9S-lipoxygenase